MCCILEASGVGLDLCTTFQRIGYPFVHYRLLISVHKSYPFRFPSV